MPDPADRWPLPDDCVYSQPGIPGLGIIVAAIYSDVQYLLCGQWWLTLALSQIIGHYLLLFNTGYLQTSVLLLVTFPVMCTLLLLYDNWRGPDYWSWWPWFRWLYCCWYSIFPRWWYYLLIGYRWLTLLIDGIIVIIVLLYSVSITSCDNGRWRPIYDVVDDDSPHCWYSFTGVIDFVDPTLLLTAFRPWLLLTDVTDDCWCYSDLVTVNDDYGTRLHWLLLLLLTIPRDDIVFIQVLVFIVPIPVMMSYLLLVLLFIVDTLAWSTTFVLLMIGGGGRLGIVDCEMPQLLTLMNLLI